MVINKIRGWILRISDLEEKIIENRGRIEKISNKVRRIN